MYKVLYLNLATPDVYEIVRSQLPEGFSLLTLSNNDDQERLEKAKEADFFLVADAAVAEKHIEAAPKLKLIQHQGVGYERIDVAAARKRGIPVALTPEGTSIGVAEHVFLLILALYKKLLKAHSCLVQGEWLQWGLRSNSYEIYGKTIGLVGFGRIAQEVALRAKAFGAKIIYFDKYVQVSLEEKKNLGAESVNTLDELLAQSDIVSIHVPMTAETKEMVNASFLQKMKDSAILVNTARGKIVNEEALTKALENKWIAGAGLDVFYTEPLAPQSPLIRLENVVLTPHISAGTCDALITKMRAAFGNMQRVLRQEEPVNQVKE